ncbi:MAG: hypothetical protein ACI97A_004092 [Planctomycetota bacterium]|jgi:hypothetical protein
MRSIPIMRRCTSLLVPVLFLLVFSTSILGQEPQEIEGGHFEWKGKKYELSAAEVQRHFEIVKSLNPSLSFARQLHLAFSRALRLTCANSESIEIDAGAFEEWMRNRHRSLRTALANQSDQGGALNAWITGKGFSDIAAYEAACREEYLGELFELKQFPEINSDESLVRKKFDEMFSSYEVSVLAFAPESLTNYSLLDLEDEGHRKLFISWWNNLDDKAKIILDDRDHPAFEAEVLYFRFADQSIDELKEFFERDRPEIGGSFEELTKSYKFGTDQLFKMAARWQQQRQGTMAHLNAELPKDLTNEKSFSLIQPHMERVWRLIKYLGVIWQDLRNSKSPVDMKAVARAKGVTYRHVPMTPTRLLFSDTVLPGDHPLYIRKITPGSIYRYTSNSASAGSIYYTDGVVDQPGIHASIWRLLEAEEMQVRKPEDVLENAWATFELSNQWRIAIDRAKHIANELDRLVAQHLKELEKDSTLDDTAKAKAEVLFVKKHFATFFDSTKKNKLDHSEILPSLFVRPENGETLRPVIHGRLGVRVANYLNMGWNQVIGAAASSLTEGQIIPMAISNERRLGILTKILKIHPPSEHRWKIDVGGRKTARDRLENGALKKRATEIRMAYAFPNNLQKFKISAPQYERIMSEALLGKTK